MALPKTATLTADGNYPIEGRFSGQNTLPGTLAVWGTFGSGTIKLQAGYAGPGGTLEWFDVPDASFTAKGFINVAFKASQMRLVISGSTAASIKYWIG